MVPMGDFELVPVASPSHPLAKLPGKVPLDALRDHVQLVLADRSKLTEGRDYSVFAVRTWRLADLGARHEMLLAGLGWGSMPRHMIEEDLKAGRLKRLDIRGAGPQARLPRPAVVLARRKGKILGPAGRWLAERLVARDGPGKRGSPTRRRDS
jgi:DNA-binding transcriptional LysR family regulator